MCNRGKQFGPVAQVHVEVFDAEVKLRVVEQLALIDIDLFLLIGSRNISRVHLPIYCHSINSRDYSLHLRSSFLLLESWILNGIRVVIRGLRRNTQILRVRLRWYLSYQGRLLWLNISCRRSCSLIRIYIAICIDCLWLLRLQILLSLISRWLNIGLIDLLCSLSRSSYERWELSALLTINVLLLWDLVYHLHCHLLRLGSRWQWCALDFFLDEEYDPGCLGFFLILL